MSHRVVSQGGVVQSRAFHPEIGVWITRESGPNADSGSVGPGDDEAADSQTTLNSKERELGIFRLGGQCCEEQAQCGVLSDDEHSAPKRESSCQRYTGAAADLGLMS